MFVSVMINFMCQFDWPEVTQIKDYFGVCLLRCLQMRLLFELMNSVKQIALPIVTEFYSIL